MTNKRKAQPAGRKLTIPITDKQWEQAKKSKSGSCLIADGLKAQYPELSNIEVDMVTIRATDRERGVRYTYLTPPDAQALLLGFDQGWAKPEVTAVRLSSAVHVRPITRAKTGPRSAAAAAAKREERIAQLELKEASGEDLSRYDRAALARA